ncbi:hypothetical protein CCL07_08765 [Pseudomonas congelans]|uniref:hypothetical protein n=1 Tax=Pseudomonas congelans TaxID=200452 RepID=UPI000BB60D46|nr:hypothetical protein [Pseudomonas congelans]PBQ07763.1 hypothetical protein CCL07_08765 [Pseudomonas congelans]
MQTVSPSSYCIIEHKHRYSAWAASRAASTNTCRFDVNTGKLIIEAVGLKELLADPELLPTPHSIDAEHRQWCVRAMQAATEHNLRSFNHGVAAKLINVYLKGAVVCAGHENHANVASLHPPIDSLLLDDLYVHDVGGLRATWAKARKLRWSKFDSSQYQDVIDGVRQAMAGKPLWQVEAHWRGYQ